MRLAELYADCRTLSSRIRSAARPDLLIRKAIQIKQLTVTCDGWRVTGKAERKMNHE